MTEELMGSAASTHALKPSVEELAATLNAASVEEVMAVLAAANGSAREKLAATLAALPKQPAAPPEEAKLPNGSHRKRIATDPH